MRHSILLLGLFGACAPSPLIVHAPPAGEPGLAPEPTAFHEPGDEGVVTVIGEEQWAVAPVGEPVRSVVYTEPGELPRLEAAGGALPLKKTSVRAHLRGPVAEVIVTQRFVNDRKTALEAIYTFPLPENGAVDRMRMVLGERVIEAQVRERGQARREYREAAAAGHTAALLEQERPNVFTQSVANIPPGQAIDVEIHYLQTLSYDAGEYEFVFPTVVGPRYVPGNPTGHAGTGRLADTDRVPDASRISPPILGRGERTGHDLAIEVVAEAGSPISTWAVPAHDVDVLSTGQQLHLKLAAHDRIPNRDFVLRYRSAAARPVARMFLAPQPGTRGGHFMLVAEPPRLDVDALVGQRELIFVLDVSGSMQGAPLALAKAAMREALAGVRPVDTFDVFVFSGRTGRLFASPRPATAANVRQALEFIDGLVASGGTEMSGAVEGALASDVPADRHRYVFFLTDGYTGEEEEIARRARALVVRQRQAGRRARVFGVGLGSAPNGHLIAELSQAGDGVPLAIHTPAEVGRAVQTFERIIDAPVVTDVALDWGGLAIDAVYPSAAPDLFASRPLVVHGRYTGAVPTSPAVTLRGAVGPKSVTFPVAVAVAGERTDVLASLWARARVDDLDLERVTDPTRADEIAKEILTTGLEYHLVTAYTSLVAVDSSRIIKGPRGTVVQPVEVPRGVSVESAYGAVIHDGAVTTKIRMDQLHSIPVGGTSRDFTSVVDMAPTAARDAAGIRLAGTVGAESRAIVDDTPEALLRSGALRDDVPSVPRATGSSKPTARTKIHAVTAATPGAAEALRALLRDDAQIAACFVDADPEFHRVRSALRLRLRVGPGARLTAIAIEANKPIARAAEACLRARIEAALQRAATPAGDATVDLRVWMRF